MESNGGDGESEEKGRLGGGKPGGKGLVDESPCRTRSMCPFAVATELGGLSRIILAVMRGNERR